MPSQLIDRLILPLFVVEGRGRPVPIKSLPGVARLPLGHLAREVETIFRRGIRTVLLFGVPPVRTKNPGASYALDSESVVPAAVRIIKSCCPQIEVMTDICLCAYTDHGHCGIVRPGRKIGPFIDGTRTLQALAAMALVHARAGADWVAPSAMAQAQVAAIRRALDQDGYRKVRIMGYSAKFASNFYGPFRQAAHSAPLFGDRRGYQLDPADGARALREIADDIREEADMVMVKPALPYLDIIRMARDRFRFPLAAYHVSGEYALLKLGARQGLFREKEAVRESLLAIRRAGADRIITYYAKDVAGWVKGGQW